MRLNDSLTLQRLHHGRTQREWNRFIANRELKGHGDLAVAIHAFDRRSTRECRSEHCPGSPVVISARRIGFHLGTRSLTVLLAGPLPKGFDETRLS